MERQIRRLAMGFLVLFVALAVNLNYLQVIAADDLANNSANKRLLVEECGVDRGDIVASDRQTVLAHDRETEGEFTFQRVYPEGERYAHVTGYHNCLFARTQLEQSFNDYLAGRADELLPQRLVDQVLGEPPRGANLVLTVEDRLQRIAQRALGNRDGAVAAIDPGSGNVLALVTNPTYDPNQLTSHRPRRVRSAYRSLDPQSAQSPLVSRATDTFFPPGSSFKIVTVAAALEDGMKPNDTLPNPPTLDVPQTDKNLENFGGGQCPGGSTISLADALKVSCNVAIAALGLELGPEKLVEQAHAFGFGEDIPFDIPFVEGQIPDVDAFTDDAPAVAQSAIGQRDVAANVLHMALVAGAIGNGGTMMVPRLVHQIRDQKGRVVRTFDPQEYRQTMSPANAGALTDLMVTVVEAGTGTAAQIPGVAVAGKTGTAQSAEGAAPHAWFVTFAPAEDPEIAVAVVVLSQSLTSEATGGQIAAPIARQVMEAVVGG